MTLRAHLAGLLLLAAPPAYAQADCITFEGRHGGVSGEVVLDLDQSEVRIGTGWWASITRRPEFGEEAQPRRIALRPGDRFREPFDPRQGCDARRRYRFQLEHDGRTFVYEYPSATGFTTDRVIDLGAVSRFFGIPPAAEPEPGPSTAGGVDMDGEWVRTESTYDPNDGMRVQVDDGSATITSRPDGATANFRVGVEIWRDMEPDGSLRVLGSDNNYYPAQIEAAGADRIALQVQHGGAGSTQTWSRAAGCWDRDAIAAHGSRNPDIWVRFSTELPSGLQNALRAARDAGAEIQTVALTPDDEWVVVAANQPCYSAGFPVGPREWIDNYIESGKQLDVVAFGPGGRWLVVAEDLIRRATNVSDEIVEEIRRAYSQGRRATTFAFSPDPAAGWMLSAGGEAYRGGSADPDLWAAVAAARMGLRPIHDIAIGSDGSWALVAEDWYASSGLPAGLLEQLERYRTNEGRRIDHVVLHSSGGRLLWAIVSNAAEPAPDPSDLINVVEHTLTGDSTVFQRMQTHRVAGVTIAVVQDNEVAWQRSYGLREYDVPESYVYPGTVFDAASISKPISYAAALQLVDSGELSLTVPGVINDLIGQELPAHPAVQAISPASITLANLLRHCAGIDNFKGSSGAQAIEPGNPLPSIAQMFLGVAPAAAGNRVVKVDTLEIGEMVDYSDANSLLIQGLVEHHAEGGFNGQLERLLDALDMSRSTYSNDFWERMPRENFAFGHDGDTLGVRYWRTDVRLYPNQSAASLRTTARDLAQFVIMLNQNGLYDDARILEEATVDRFFGRDRTGRAGRSVSEAACQDNDSMRLGIRVDRPGEANEVFFHGGTHNGYRTFMYGLPGERAGVVIMSTGSRDEAGRFARELRDALSAAYRWPALR